MAGGPEASPEAKPKTKEVVAETDDLAMETKRTALLDRLEAQLKAPGSSFTTRALVD